MRRVSFVVAMLLGMVLVISGCGNNANTASSTNSAPEATSESSTAEQEASRATSTDPAPASEADTAEATGTVSDAEDPNGLEFAGTFDFEEFEEFSGGMVYRDKENGYTITTGDFYIEDGEGFLKILVEGNSKIQTMIIPVNLEQEKASPVLGQGGDIVDPDTEFTGVKRTAELDDKKISLTFGKGFFEDGQSCIDVMVTTTGGGKISSWSQAIPVTIQ